MNKKSKRRMFLTKTIQSMIAITTGTSLLEVRAKEAVNKVKLLTADGKLVELDPEVINQKSAMSGKKASNSEILNWTKQVKLKPPTHE